MASSVSSLINSSDAENGSTNGVAVHGLNSSRGTWQYSIDGGGTWTSIVAASDNSALLLRNSDYLRFVPDGDNADAASVDVYAWDGTNGTAGSFVDVSSRGGTTAYSLTGDTAAITVTAVNDAPVLTGSSDFAGITEDQTNSNGQLVSSLLTSTDVDTGAQQGIAISALQSGNGSWQYSLDGGTSWTNVGAVSDTAALLLTNTDRIRFVPDGIDADAASITFHAWDQASGTAGGKVSVVTTGGTTAFSTASATASIAVSALNDAPIITGTSDFIAISEDATGGVGQLVSSLVGTSDVDDSPATGVALHSQNAGRGTWQYSVDGGSTWSNVTGLSDATALLLRGSDRLRFLPDGLNADAPSLSFYAWDQTTGTAGTQADASTRGGTTAFSSLDGTSQLAVTAVNDAPVLTGTQPFAPITEDSVNNGGQLVSSLITTTDVDSGAVNGVAIYGQSAGNGTWQYSTDGGTSWNSLGSVTGNAALLLGASDRLRFVPDGRNADAASLSYYAWDQSTGTAGSTADVSTRGGTTAFSTAAGTSSITVTAINDAPTLSASHDFSGITEDDTGNPGQLVSTLLDVNDVDNGAATGVAIYGQTAGNGRWQYSTNGGGTWTDLGTVAGNAARLLRGTDYLRFVPDGHNADAASLSFYAWDQSSGSAGSLTDAGTRGGTTAFSLTGGSSAITVSAVNDAPVITGTSNLVTIDEDQVNNNGQLVSTLYTASDVDTGALTGIAIDGTSSSYGQWQYSTDGGASWNSVGTVSDTSALLLRDTDRVRFVPDGFNGETATLSFRAWDRTTGAAGTLADVSSHGGTTAFSASTTTSTLTITGVNEAPVLSGANNFNTVLEDDMNSAGTRVTSLLGTFLSDVDDIDQPGLAITAVDNSHGTWQYTTDGVTWLNVGNVSVNSARLLTGDSLTAIRFVPDADWTGTASITFQGWDGTAGTPGGLGNASVSGGTSAFSTASATSNLMVFAVNDAPVFTGNGDFTGITEDDTSQATNPGRLVSSLFTSTDVDSGALSGVAIHAQTGSHGTWQYSTDGTTWQDLGTVSDTAAMLLRSTDHLRFLPDGTRGTNASLSVYAWDQDSGNAGSTADASVRGGATAFSTAGGITHITVSDLNDAPVMSALTLSASAIPFASWTSATLLDQAFDVDGDALSVSIVTGPSHGTLVQLADGSWRYEGTTGYVGADTFTYRAVDAQSQSTVIRTVQIDVVNPLPAPGGNNGTGGAGSGTGSGTGNSGSDRPTTGNDRGDEGSNTTPGQNNGGGEPSWPDLGQDPNGRGEDASQDGGAPSITEMIDRIRGNANLGRLSQDALGGRNLALSNAYANFVQNGMPTGGGSVLQLLELIKSNLGLANGDIDLQITPLNTVSHALPLEGSRPSRDMPGSSEIPTISLTKAASYSTGLGLSIGTIWWTARISGLLTSALISTPAWRSLDPLPVITSPHDDDPEQGGGHGHDGHGDPDKDVEHLFDADRPVEDELPVIE
ncbi:MAG: Ig-like domain-containing protein [Aquabacterium sp.]